MNLDPKTSVIVPEERYGLHAIDTLDPDMVSAVLFSLQFQRK